MLAGNIQKSEADVQELRESIEGDPGELETG